MDIIIHLAIILAIVFGIKYYNNVPYDRGILADKADEEYDYIIVGGGSAGSVLAARLSEDTENTVLLLEAGGFYDKTPELHSPMDWVPLMKTEHAWQYYTEPQTHSTMGMMSKQSFWPRGRVLGGSSTINAMMYTRGSRFDYDEWAANGCSGWGYKDVLPYFLKSENTDVPELKSSIFHSSVGPLAVSSGRATQLGPLFLKAGQEMGYEITDYNSADNVGFSETQMTIRDGVRSSAGVEFLGNTKTRTNLDILLESLVTKIEIQNDIAIGVYFIKDNKKHYVRARKEVIISAGAINTPQLLMLSEIGPKDHLTEMGIDVIADLPVGENLQDHELVFLLNKISKPLSITQEWRDSWWTNFQYNVLSRGVKTGTGQEVLALVHTEDSTNRKTYPDIQLFIASQLFPSAFGHFFNYNDSVSAELFEKNPNDHGFTTMVMLAHPKSKGTIRLRSRDPFDHPVIDPKYFTDDRDVKTLTGGIRIWERMLETKTMKELGVNINDERMSFCAEHKFQSDDYWECFIRHVGCTVYHHSGTCKMGAKDDPTAVVDPELRVQGIKRLRVVDTSVFPNVTSGNTNAPVIMVAEKAADLIRGKDTVSHFRRNIPEK